MMSSIKFTILFSVVLFAAYAQYEAGKTVKNLKINSNRKNTNMGKSNTAEEVFMRRALELSQLALKENHGHPFGSVVVKDGKIIGEGWNKTKLLKDPSAHAEVEAIRDASKMSFDGDLTGSTIYASAEPCPMCLSLIYLTGITKVYYCIPHSMIENYDNDLSVGYIYKELGKPQDNRTIPEQQMLSAEAGKYVKSYN